MALYSLVQSVNAVKPKKSNKYLDELLHNSSGCLFKYIIHTIPYEEIYPPKIDSITFHVIICCDNIILDPIDINPKDRKINIVELPKISHIDHLLDYYRTCILLGYHKDQGIYPSTKVKFLDKHNNSYKLISLSNRIKNSKSFNYPEYTSECIW